MSISFAGLRPEFGVVVELVVQVSCSVLSTKHKTGDSAVSCGVSSILLVQTSSVKESVFKRVVKEVPAAATKISSGLEVGCNCSSFSSCSSDISSLVSLCIRRPTGLPKESAMPAAHVNESQLQPWGRLKRGCTSMPNTLGNRTPPPTNI